MQKTETKEELKKVGSLLDEISEAQKLSPQSDDAIFTLTVECSAFFTLVCC